MNIKMLLAVSALALTVPLAANAASVNYDFSGLTPLGGAYTAQFNLDVVGGQAVSGTGFITGVNGATTEALTLITLATQGVENDGGGLLGYRFNDGTDIFDADTAAPIDSNGLVFAIGPNAPQSGQDAGFAIWDNGGGNFQTFFASKGTVDAQQLFGSGTAVGGAVPEPASWAVMLVGFGGLGVAMRSRRKQAALA
jgi:hypothetical protein